MKNFGELFSGKTEENHFLTFQKLEILKYMDPTTQDLLKIPKVRNLNYYSLNPFSNIFEYFRIFRKQLF